MAVRIRLQVGTVRNNFSSPLLRDLVRGFANNVLNCGRFVIPLGYVNDITLNNDQIKK
jgi:hypothetical protein